MNELNEISMDLSIDKYHLDSECLTHPTIYHKYLSAAAEAENLLAEKKDNLKIVFATTQTKVREALTAAGTKFTEAVVAANIDLDPDYIAAQKEVREIQAVVLNLQAAVKAMDSRRSALDNLVKLYSAGYFSSMISETDQYDKNAMVSNELRNNLAAEMKNREVVK